MGVGGATRRVRMLAYRCARDGLAAGEAHDLPRQGAALDRERAAVEGSAAPRFVIQAVMEHPDQWRIVMSDPGMIPSFVEESLRYDSPIQGLFRTTRATAEVAGTRIPEGARVLLLFGSANRDDHHYRDADTFIGTRGPVDHLAFGKGIHYRLGAHLARLELTLLLRALLTRLRRLLE